MQRRVERRMGSIIPHLANDKYQLGLIEVERDVMLDGGGGQNPRYLAMAKRVDQMKAAYAKQVEVGKAKVAERLNELRLEAAAARGHWMRRVNAWKRLTGIWLNWRTGRNLH